MATRSPGNIHDRTFHTASQVEKEVDKKVVVAVLLCHSRALQEQEECWSKSLFFGQGEVGRNAVFLSASGLHPSLLGERLLISSITWSRTSSQSWLGSETSRDFVAYRTLCPKLRNNSTPFCKRFRLQRHIT